MTATEVLHLVQDPHTIFFLPYLAFAALVATAWLRFCADQSWRLALRNLAPRQLWTASSTRHDLLFTAVYLLGLRVPLAAVEAAVFYGTLRFIGPHLASLIPATLTLTANPALEASLATLVTMLAIDLATYLAHRAMHERRLLWAIHALHHSAEVLTPLTTYRQHPLEPLLLNVSRGGASALGLSVLHAFFINETPVVTVFGLGAGFFVYMFTTNLHHCHIPVRYPRCLRWFLISPHQHQLHHSLDERHHGHNYGVVFALWDRLFGTYLEHETKLGELEFGLAADELPQGLLGRLAYPFSRLKQLVLTKSRCPQSSALKLRQP